MLIGVPKETCPGERRVALVPAVIPGLIKKGMEVRIETGAGKHAGFPDGSYSDRGAVICGSREEVFDSSEILLQVRTFGTNPLEGKRDLALLKAGQAVIGLVDPLSSRDRMDLIARTGAVSYALELIPRITRAQGMDVLSSQATISGYKAALIAANSITRIFPTLMTAAGTITAARIFVIGAGVAGLQAIATCHRLGAIVQAYDVRPVVREQVVSVGGRFVDLDLECCNSEDGGGYARQMNEEFYARQREMMMRVVPACEAVISTASVPGKKAPILITEEMVDAMTPGSVIVDIAAEHGGNCELTVPGETILRHGVSVLGPLDLPSSYPYHASQMYAKNIAEFLSHLLRNGKIDAGDDDPIIRGTLVTAGGRIMNERVLEAV